MARSISGLALARRSLGLEWDDVASAKRILLEIDGRPPIHGPSTKGSVAPLESVDEVNESGETASFGSANRGNASIVKELLKHSTGEEVFLTPPTLIWFLLRRSLTLYSAPRSLRRGRGVSAPALATALCAGVRGLCAPTLAC